MSKLMHKKCSKVIIFNDNNKGFDIKLCSIDKKNKNQRIFEIKYDLNKTKQQFNESIDLNESKSIENNNTNELFLRKDSFDRFGDDLCELLLSYLTLKQKFCFECVSKQWKRLVFNKQNKLIITNDSNCFDSINGLFTLRKGIDCHRLELLLQKCCFVNEIQIIDKLFTTHFISDNVLNVLINSGIRLKTFICCLRVENLSIDVFNSFGLKFAKSLTQLRFRYLSDSHFRTLFSANSFPNLEKLRFDSELSEDIVRHFSRQSIPKLKYFRFTFRAFDGLNVLTNECFERIKILDIVLDTDISTLVGNGVNRALIELSKLKNMEILNLKIFCENTIITAIDKGLKSIANNCQQLKRLDFIMDFIVINDKLFNIFSQFRSLEFCEISIEFNNDMTDYGSIASFAVCKNIRVFNLYLYNICDQHLIDIDIYLPNITNLHIKSNTGITDLTLNYLRNCPKLEVFEVHTYNDSKTKINLSDSGICLLIKSCPKLRVILLFSRSKRVSFTTVFEFLTKAKQIPKVKHIFGSINILDLIKSKAIRGKGSNQSIVIPYNLRLIELPQWKHINTFTYVCNP